VVRKVKVEVNTNKSSVKLSHSLSAKAPGEGSCLSFQTHWKPIVALCCIFDTLLTQIKGSVPGYKVGNHCPGNKGGNQKTTVVCPKFNNPE